MGIEFESLIRGGDLPGARQVLLDSIRAEPNAVWPRWLLFELSALRGAWGAARAQLEALRVLDSPRSAMYQTYAQLGEVMTSRDAVWRGEHPPCCSDASWLVWERRAKTIPRLGLEDPSAGNEWAELTGGTPQPLAGRCDGKDFQSWADQDVRFGFGLEAIIEGAYWWLRWGELTAVRFAGTRRRLRDLVWQPVLLTLTGGKTVQAFLPARYPGTEAGGEAPLLLGRATSLRGPPHRRLGLGVHLYRAGSASAEDIPLTGFTTLDFTQPAPV